MIEIPVKRFEDYIKNESPIFYTYDFSIRLYKEYESYNLIIANHYFAYTKIDRLTAFEMIANYLRKEYDLLMDISKDICESTGEDREKTIDYLKKKLNLSERKIEEVKEMFLDEKKKNEM